MTHALAPSVPDLPPARGRMSHGAALWLYGAMLTTYLAASTAPSPLYALYREAWGFSALTLTLVFASYAFALLAALLVFGVLSDHRGRREVVILALAGEIAALLLFRHADSVAWLLAARVVQGAATGVATAVLSAGLLDVHKEHGPLLNSVTPLAGMALGAVGAGALAQFAPAPTRLVYDVLLGLLGVQTAAAFWLPETAARRPGALASLRPRLAVPAAARQTLLQILPANTAQWALGGFYASLGPSLTRIVTGSRSPALGGAVVATLVLAGALAVGVMRRRPARLTLVGGTTLLAVGVAITLAGVAAHSTALFFAGTVVAGLGFGASFNGSVRSLVPLAQAHERAGLMSTFYVLSYLAFSLPALAAGLAAGRWGLEAASTGYGVLLVALSLTALALMARRR